MSGMNILQPELNHELEVEPVEGVAIIGMAGRFPGAPDVTTFWQNILAKKDSITRFTPEQLEARDPVKTGQPDYVRARGVLEDAAMFDADFFGIPPREADVLDPQHRLLLETCHNALEDAGYVPQEYSGEIGLFAGCSLNTYLLANLAHDRAFLDTLTAEYQVGDFQVALGNDKDFLTTRIAYKLNLRGPCVSVQAACATSLVAVCQAAQALLNYQCDMALAGGVSVTFPQHRGHIHQEGSLASKDGVCRPFDAEASGTVFGHGVGAVLLKRADEAVRDGDHIYAIIRGFAVNNDGAGKAGYMAPSVEGQTRVIQAAQAMAGFPPETISAIEAHGTGTPLGDPIEVAALTRAFRTGTDETNFCTIGTAKANVGHLDAAAGITGLIKMALSLEQATLPGLANYTAPNPNLALEGSPFRIATDPQPWTSETPRRAGVSAFGVGGVNAHVVLEEFRQGAERKRLVWDSASSHGDQLERRHPERSEGSSYFLRSGDDSHGTAPANAQTICLSARSETALTKAKEKLAVHLESHPDTSLPDIAFTLNTGRRTFPHRFAFAAATTQEAITALRASSTATTPIKATPPRTAFLFSGQGSQFPSMGKALYASEPIYKHVIDQCAAASATLLSTPLTTLLFDATEETLQQTSHAQPALFATELALARLYESWGIEPELMAGHSLGEFVASTLAGVFTPAAAMRLVCRRAELMQQMTPGAMLSVPLPEEALTRFLNPEASPAIELAAANSPRSSVLAGPLAAVEALEATLTDEGITFRRLCTSHAFHSQSMEPMLAAFKQAVAEASPQPPTRPYVSTLTGNLITAEEATSPAYWARHCRQTVRFSRAVETLLSRGIETLLEVGPGHSLASLALHHKGAPGVSAFTSLSSLSAPGASPERSPAHALADLWARGASVQWEAVYAGQGRRRVSLPTYPFERRFHWVSPPAPPAAATTPAASVPQTSAPHQAPPAQNMTQTPAPATSTAAASRLERLQTRIAQVLSDLSGLSVGPQEFEANFLELGFDSLFLTQATGALSKTFAVKLTFRQLMEQFSSIATLATHLDATLPPEAFAAAPAPAPAAVLPSSTGSLDVQRLLDVQIATLSQMFAAQISALQAAATGQPAPATVAASQAATQPPAASAEVRHGSFRPPQPTARHDITPTQQSYIDNLVRAYEAKTPGSKRATAAARPHLADPRAVAGFRPQWKEMVYPLVTDRALGSRLWDIDGNEYIDLVNGYGCIMFGHSPDFVVRAAHEQLDRGVAIGPQSVLAGEVAALLCELTGNDRATFCNTGSEAVMAAIRVARTVTGRDRIVYFAGDYHGTFDEVLIRNTPRGSAPVAPGIPVENVRNVTVLEYGADSSLAWIREHAEEIAAVLIEPVQTRNPGFQPIEFIRTVRQITEQIGSALILDEVVTGFRLAPGGVQEQYGIRADMCTYGKVIGGGHPIGVLSGKAQYLDALDGGVWQYGDDSAPEVGVTFFAGTFVRHPLALAAARSVLTYLKEQGPELQRTLNTKAAGIAQRLDVFLAECGVPTRVHSFASWFYFVFPHESRFSSLFYYAMRARGIHIQEGYPCFLTTAHTDADLAAVERAFRETVLELQAADILPGDATPPEAPTLTAEPELSSVATTAAQREIFFAAALSDEANCAFNESVTVRLQGPVRTDTLTHAFRAAIQRHDALRSTVSTDGETLNIAPTFPGELEQVGLQNESPEIQQRAIAARMEVEARKPFDLHNGPLLRAVLFSLSQDEAVLLLVAHHIVFDGWSANQFLEEVGKLYSTGDSATLTPVLPFSRFAARERSRTKSGYFADNEHYWVEKFTGLAPKLDLPTDRPRPALKSFKGGTIQGHLTAEQRDALKKLSAKNGCTLFATLLSGFQLLLHRLTSQDEVVVGISAAGQALDENTSLVGHCVNFLPILSTISRVSPGETIQQHLKATRTALLDAYDHQEFTYGTLLSKLRLERDPSRLPLIEVQFNLERVGDNVRFDGLNTTIRANPKQFVNTDLFLNVIETPGGLEYMCDYNADLFDASTVGRWMANWSTLLASASEAEPTTPVATLNLLPATERDLVLNAWNGTAADFGPFESVPAAFLRQSTLCPSKIAVKCGARQWTYAELAEYTELLAARMLHEGLKPGDLVGICMERSPEMIGALLAVLMAGAAYVPLDPRHPRERMSMIVADAGISMLLCGRDPSVETTAKILKVTGPQANAGKARCAALKPEDLAYVIYTSGSTGIPKGVAIQHGALRNLLCAMQRIPGFAEHDVFLAVTTLAFDIATLELLNPLLVGAQLVIATEEQVQDGRQLLQLIANARVTALQATPGAWRLLLDAGWTGAEPLKVLCGGEALPRDLADRLTERSSDVWNMYGPTETTIWSSATRVLPGSGPITVGPPTANTQFYVLDELQQPVPLGCTGELLIGGDGLAKGYWKRPELTAEKFLPNPFHPGRMYRTGDLGRLRANGTIELLGRSDFQVKIRGYRIELGDIEAALTRHPAVKEAAVVQHRPNGEAVRAQLVAFAAGSQTADGAELHDLLASTLPEYMVPTAIHLVNELPRNTNGKVDRKALERLAAERSADTPTQRKILTPPETPEEKQLAAIWCEVLGLTEVSTTDSIFELGADSLLIFRIAARAGREGLPITATMIFQHRTVSALCRALAPQKAANTSAARTRVSIPVAARDNYRRSKVEVDQ